MGLVTIEEALTLIAPRHRKTALTPRRIRHLAAQQLLKPQCVSSGRGRARLYNEADLGLMRLYLWLSEKQGLPTWNVWAILAFLGENVRTAVQRGTDTVVVLDGITGTLVSAAKAETMPGRHVSVRALHVPIPKRKRATAQRRAAEELVATA